MDETQDTEMFDSHTQAVTVDVMPEEQIKDKDEASLEDASKDEQQDVIDNSMEEGELRNVEEEENNNQAMRRCKYTEGQWSPLNPNGKKHYDREFLIQFQFHSTATTKPAGFPDIPGIVLEKPIFAAGSRGADYIDFNPKYFWPGKSGDKKDEASLEDSFKGEHQDVIDNNMEEGELRNVKEEGNNNRAMHRCKYTEGQWSPLNPNGKKHYDREFLIQFQFHSTATTKPAGFPDIPGIVLEKPIFAGADYIDFNPKYFWPGKSGGIKYTTSTDNCQYLTTTFKEAKSIHVDFHGEDHESALIFDNALGHPVVDAKVTFELDNQKGEPVFDSTSSCHRKCEPCSFDDEIREASGFCVKCLEYICSDCCRDHRRNKMTRDHLVLKGDDMPEDSTQYAKMNELMKCPVHADNDISFKCKDHGEFICLSCFAEKHRTCEHVLDIAENDYAEESSHVLLTQCDALKAKCRFLAEHREVAGNVLIKEREALESKVHAIAEELRSHIALLEARFKNKLGKLFRQGMFAISKETDLIGEHQANIDELRSLVSTVGSHGCKREVIIINKHIQDRLRKIDAKLCQSTGKKLRHLKLTQAIDKTSFTSLATLKLVNEHVIVHESLIQTQSSSDEITDACKHPEEETEENEVKPIKMKTTKYKIGVGKPDLSKQQTTYIPNVNTSKSTSDVLKTLTPMQNTSPNPNWFITNTLEKRSYNIKHSTNIASCYIIDCTVLPDGQIAILDYGNMSLKLCSPDFDITMMLQFNDRPVSICSEAMFTDDTIKIFISFANSKQIICYKVTPIAIAKAGNFSLSMYPICIRMVNCSLLILASNRKRLDNNFAKSDVVELSLRCQNGKIIKETKFNISDGSTFMQSKVISVSGSTLVSIAGREVAGYHFDPSLDRWIGMKLWFLATDQLLTYVEVDADGNAYICGKDKDVVQQVLISQNRLSVNRNFVTGVHLAACLSIDSERHRVIIGTKHDEIVVCTY
ncbi:uncharacterized protein LOC127835025 isoform X2 [Dreissena polymorpha]|uniref:uncharacterized protein LOC127835025 isoform X2 n=1 Tax=Dreissena polymorpha TaxID=45954 RepID=UPI002263B997|nr:uncharacterized protein LOC127835025 isoform X2 [Dreissena polymorpha]